MKKTLRLLSLLLAFLLIVAMLTACKENPNTEENPETTESNNAVTGGPTGDVTTEYVERLPDPVDTNGYDYIIRAKDNSLWFEMYSCEAQSQTGDIISDALYERELLVEDLYKCKISFVKDSKIKDTLEINNEAGDGADHLADIVFMPAKDSLGLAMKGIYENVFSFKNLQLQHSYWDQNIQNEYKIGNALYLLEGDINVRDDLRTMQITFNKDLYEVYGLDDEFGSLYDLVREYKWTYEIMMAMCQNLYSDADNDSRQSMKDTYGMISEATAPYYFFLGSGKKPVTNDNGKLTLHLTDTEILESVDETIKLASMDSICIINNGKIAGTSSVWDDAITLFVNDQGLFRSSALSSVNGYVNMKSDYGILPVPMVSDTQTRYYCWTAAVNHYPLAIPAAGIKDYNTSTMITEALAFYSKYAPNDSLNDAFYSKLGDYRLGQTPEDTLMLDIIFESKTYELDQAIVISKLENRMYSLTKERFTGSLKSEIDSMFDLTKSNLTSISEAFAKLERSAQQ